MSYHKSFISAVLLCLLSSNLPSAPQLSQDQNLDEEASLDGAAWRSITEGDQERADLAKQYYLKGLYEGLQMGFTFTSQEGLKQAYHFDTNREHLARALDQFYQDYRNQQIPAILALQVIAMELRGDPKEEIDSELRRIRRERPDILKRAQ